MYGANSLRAQSGRDYSHQFLAAWLSVDGMLVFPYQSPIINLL
jgi:hypothetical protein